MSNYSQIPNQNVENINDEEFFEKMPNENCEFFKRALFEAMDMKIHEIEQEAEDVKMPPPSIRHKIRMNRLFRERVGGSLLPFPEVDNFYERVRRQTKIRKW